MTTMYSVNTHSDTLTHYGVKGMKWGVRKKSYTSTNAKKSLAGFLKSNKKIKSSKKVNLKNAKNKQKPEKKAIDISKLSDAELNNLVNRLRLEENYRQLNPKKISTGDRVVKALLDGTMIGLQNATSATVNNILTNAMNDAMGNPSKKK